ncbi:MAG: UvrD-helicase domain-containing protein, partial [Eubacteriales bacterium]|nr:UvrD-helicase domain-containing protein [Eubacteriales bacterium]
MKEQSTAMAWTKQQEQAINERGKSILVSAAAGSGKTAVMVERIIRMILDGSASLDEMLIVTFTNAAAQEMKEKIRKALRKQSKEDPKMRRQLELLPQAGISTFHSFALSVIRQNFYLIGMEPAFQIADESRIALMIEDAFDELFDSEYEKGDRDFLRFLDWYSTEKTDEGARDVLKEIYRKIEALPDPFGTLEKAVNDLSEADSFSDLSSSDQIFEEIGKETAEIQDDLQALHSLLSGAGCPELASLYTLLLSQTAKMAENASRKDISGVQKYLEAAKFPRMAAKKAEKEAYAGVKERAVILRDDAKEQMKALENEYFFKPEEELF